MKKKWLNYALIGALSCPPVVAAINGTWVPTTAGTYPWDSDTNWNPNTGYPGTTSTGGDTATFPSALSVAETIQLASAITLQTLTLADNTGGGFTIEPLTQSTDTITFTGTTAVPLIALTGSIVASDVISANIIITSNGGNPLNVNNTGGTTNVPLVLSGSISDAGNGIQFAAAAPSAQGLVQLSGSNTYTGPTTLTLGIILQVHSPSNFGDSSGINFGTENPVLDMTTGFTLAQPISLQASPGGGTIQVDAGTGALLGLISGVTGAGLQLQGAGTIALANSGNTYSGTTTIAGPGIVQITVDGNLGAAAGAVTFSGASTLELGGSFTSSARATTLNAAATFQVDPTITVTWSGTIGGGSGLTKTGTGTLIVGDTNSYSGTTTVSAGTFQAGNNSLFSSSSAFTVSSGATLALNNFNQTIASLAGAGSVTLGSGVLTTGGNNSNTTFSGAITGSGGLTQNGTGTFTLSGTGNNTYGGATTLSAGTLQGGAANSFSSSSAVTVSSGATLDLNNFSQTIGSLTGAGSVTLGSGTLITGGNNTSTTFSGAIAGVGGGLTKMGSGTLILSGTSNTYSGTTTVSLGTLQAGAAGSFSSSSAVTVSSGATLALNDFDQTISSLAGAGSVTLGSGTLTTGGSNATTAFSGAITGTGAVTKTGSGTFALSGTGNNTYGGATTVSAGTLQGGAANSFSSSSAVTVSSGATLDLNNFSQTIGSLTGAGSVTLGSGTLITGGNNASTIFSGSTTGSGGLTKMGSGTLILSGTSNTYSGTTTVSLGTLQAGAAGSFSSSSAVTVSSGATLALNDFDQTIGSLAGSGSVTFGTAALITGGNNASTTFSGSTTGSGGLTKTGSGTFVLAAAQGYTGGTTISGGTLQVGADSYLGGASGDITLNTATLEFTTGFTTNRTVAIAGSPSVILADSGQTATLSGVITGTTALSLTGAGIVVLDGDTTGFTGAITVEAGQLIVNAPTPGLGATSTTVQSGAMLKGTGHIQNLVTVNSGAILAAGNSPGTLHVGTLDLLSGSTFQVEIDPAQSSDTIVATAVTIPSGVTIDIIADPGSYSPLSTYIIMQAPSISGTFSPVVNPFVGIGLNLEYQPTQIILTATVQPFSSLLGGLKPNAQAVANYFDAIFPVPSGTDLYEILTILKLATSIEQLNKELLSLQPSHLKGLGLVQENNTMLLNQALLLRGQSLYRAACIRDSQQRKSISLWGDLWGDFMHQAHYQGETGFHTNTGGAVLGVDYQFCQNLYVGLAGAYSYSKIDWNQSVGKASAQGYYGALYATWFNSNFFANGALVGAYDFYTEQRSIYLSTPALGGLSINRRASADFGGGEGAGYLNMGALFTAGGVEFSPFVGVEYYYLHQGAFQEAGADSIDLKVKSCNADLLRTLLGIGAAKCYPWGGSKWIPSASVSVVREERFVHSVYHATMKGNESVYFTVHGMRPNRTLVAPQLGITGWMCGDRCSFSLFYTGEFNATYQDQQVNLQVGYGF